ncbi:MAG TPA: methyltransferase domain-containing protein, partial [Candidatus Angelobacter sp.]|nr:methyltransferase domain-containing protein [Candidatus Angelobacter sp.]
ALAHPKWLVQRWFSRLGADVTRTICDYDQRVPATSVRLGSVADEGLLAAEGVQLASGALLANSRTVVSGDVVQTQLFRSGRISIQDEGSQLVAALVGEGKHILDCCAAPGGKTAAMATRLPEAEIFAAELHPHRARLLRRLVRQQNVHVITADALALPFAAQFDRVLADVPCSGTGTLARNPEIKWRLSPSDLRDLQSRQIAILKAAMGHVQSGGRVVYSTCSLEPEENEEVVATCMRDHPEFKIIPVREELMRLQQSGDLVWKEPEQLLSGDFLRTVPGIHPCDGFFSAILQRR